MRMATINRNTANACDSARRDRAWASFAPSGAISTEAGAINAKPNRLTSPTVDAGQGHARPREQVTDGGGRADQEAKHRRCAHGAVHRLT